MEKAQSPSPPKKKKQEEQEEQEEEEVWKWWEEEKRSDGTKWDLLQHKGPVFAPPYEPLPPSVKFYYNGEEMKLSRDTEEVATFYARMLDHDYTSKSVFNNNFFSDWRDVMTESERAKITDLLKCNFEKMHTYFLRKSEAMIKEEKQKIKEKDEEIQKEYGFCTVDGHKQKIGNFKIEPPCLFRGRGEHPKMGKLKKRVLPEDVRINCSEDSNVPKPPAGHKWKEVQHDRNVTWLASWTENIQGQVKYVKLDPSSKFKGEKDLQKYETARNLGQSIDKIRSKYREDWKSKEMRIRQRAVALYFIDKLALRAGNEKNENQADTVGCCSLRVEHIKLEQKDGRDYVVLFDFLGKDSIRYYNEVPVEKRVFKNLELFMEHKSSGDDLFDQLNTTVMNKYLNELMEGLTAKVFRTYNASWTLQQQLDKLTDPNNTEAEKIQSYEKANRKVAILCNHQHSVSNIERCKKLIKDLEAKIEAKEKEIPKIEQAKYAKREGEGDGDREGEGEEEGGEGEAEGETEEEGEGEKEAEKEAEGEAEGERGGGGEAEGEREGEGEGEGEGEAKEESEGEEEGEAKRYAKHSSVKKNVVYEKKKQELERLKEQLRKEKIYVEENKEIALGSSKLNYIDPRISVAWCKKYNVPIEKIYSKTERDKFRWAIEMAGPDFVF